MTVGSYFKNADSQGYCAARASPRSDLEMNAPKDQLTTLESRLARLDEVERKIMLIMQHAGNALEELSKDKPIAKQVENHTHNFRMVVKEVESEMNAHITYLNQISAGLPYEGNTYNEAMELYQTVDKLLLIKEKLSAAL